MNHTKDDDMASGVFDDALLKHLWSTDELRAIFSDRNRVAKWYAFESALAIEQAAMSIIPQKAADEIVRNASVDKVDIEAIAAEIREDVCRNGFDRELGSFVQSYGSKWLDGSLLLIPTTGFLPLDDHRILGTIRAVEKRLLQDGLVMRHDPAETETGLAHGERAFLACSFWLVDALVLTGRAAEGERLFERLLGLCNDVGLLAEEFDVRAGRLVGNFPQAFSHVALVNSAHNLARSAKPAEQRAGSAAVES